MEILVIVFIIFLVACYFWYVSIIARKNKALEGLSGIDVQLKKRSNLIPNVLVIAQKYMDHEKELINEVTRLRTQFESDYNPKDSEQVKGHLKSAQKLDSLMGKLMVNMEAYPELKSDQTLIKAQEAYLDVESNISAARRFYNAAVTKVNNSVQIFPGNIIGALAGVTALPFYEIDEASMKPVLATDILK